MTNIIFTSEGFVATLVLNRPEKMNAITPEMAIDLTKAAAQINADPNVRVVILTGAGERAFSAGSDIRLLDTYASPWAFRNRSEYNDIIKGIQRPVICAVNGYALGGGLELALAADIIIASDNAKFGAPEVKLGWVGGGGVASGLVSAIGSRNAAYMLMTGDMFPAEQMRSWGLVSEVWDAGKLMQRAREIADKIAANAPLATQTAKINISAAINMPADQSTRYERDLQTVCFASEDALEGRRAFAEKRLPNFKGN